MALLLPLPALAQASAPCGGAPCMQIGREDPDHGNGIADDADHFVYCPEGETVQVKIIARPATIPCNDCEHDARTVTWTVSGTTNHTVTDASTSMTFNQTEINATILLGDAGDTVTITCTVAEASTDEERCEEDRHGNAEHTGSHAQATASCTIKLWRMDMAVTGAGSEQVPPFTFTYNSTFAGSATTTATLVGATAAPASETITPWEWKSIELDEFEILNTMEGSNSWDGTLVASTAVDVKVIVINRCDPATNSSTSDYVIINPNKRRSGWEMVASHGGEDETWKSDKPNGFPVIDMWDFGAWAQNTNSDSTYQDQNQVIVTPVYSGTAVPANLYASFTGVREKISDGPNLNLWYLTDPTLFTAARKSRVNRWITPGVDKSSTAPASGPQGISYSGWSNIYTVLGTDTCACSNPSSHGGVGGNIRYKANIWHEGYGCPSSANQLEIGHQARLENVVDNGSKSTYDAVWKCDLMYSKSEGGLLDSAESARFSASQALKAEMLKVHTFVTNEPEKHNFRGIMWITDGAAWDTDGDVSTY